MIEEYEGEITTVKLTEADARRLINGEILEGHKVKIGIVTE